MRINGVLEKGFIKTYIICTNYISNILSLLRLILITIVYLVYNSCYLIGYIWLIYYNKDLIILASYKFKGYLKHCNLLKISLFILAILIIIIIIKFNYLYGNVNLVNNTTDIVDMRSFTTASMEPQSHFSDWGSSTGWTPSGSEAGSASSTGTNSNAETNSAETSSNANSSSSQGNSLGNGIVKSGMSNSNSYPNGFNDTLDSNVVRVKSDTFNGSVVTGLTSSPSLNSIDKP